ncbi:MAG: 50S ribosomal protein L25 [Chitinophagales bacterium]
MQTLTIEGKVRSAFGKNAAKSNRKKASIPCVLSGGGTTINFETSEKELRHLIFTPNFYKVNVTIDGNSHEALMQEVQFHPVTDQVLHVDFLKLDPKKKVRADVPVRLTGQAAGVRAGAKLIQKIKKLTIKALPEHLVDNISLDVTPLEVGKSIRIGEVAIEHVEILGTKSTPIVSCLIPRVIKLEEEKPADATAAVAAGATPAADATAAKTDEKEKGKDDKKDKK